MHAIAERRMESWVGKVALVTGASAGIGEGIAKLLVQNGMKVLGVSRNPDKIKTTADSLAGAKGKLYPMKCDIRSESNVKEVFEYAKRELGGVDVCINNAGLAHDAPLLSPDTQTEAWRDMIETNVLSVCVINREFMRQMKERGTDVGHIIIINSMSGHRVMNNSQLHFYSATYFALTALANGVRFELRNMKSNIRVSSISPGIVRTEFRERLWQIDHSEAMKYYDEVLYTDVMKPEDIASAVICILSMPPRTEVNDIRIRPTGQVN